MKVFVILLMAVVAIAMANPTWNDQTSLKDVIREGNMQGHEWNEGSKNKPTWNNDYASDEDKLSPRRLPGREQPWNDDSSDSNEDKYKSQRNHHHDDDDMEGHLVDVQPFRTKIMRRLEESQQLSNQPEITNKITKLVEDKFDACKHQSAGSKGKADRHCLGRATGQMMQMIAAFESGTRNLPNSYDF